MAAIRLEAIIFLLIYINLSKAIETLDEGECGPCVVEECQPIPNDCTTEITLDKCGCCRICNKVFQPALRDFSPPKEGSSVKEATTTRYIGSPLTLSYETSVNRPTNNAFHRMQMFPLETNGRLQKSFTVHQYHSPIVLHFSGPGNPILSLLREIQRRQTRYNNYGTSKFLPSCRLYRYLSMGPKFHQDNYNNPMFQNINEPYQKANYRPSNVFRVTRFRVIPLRMIVKKVKVAPLYTSPFSRGHTKVNGYSSSPPPLYLGSYRWDGNRYLHANRIVEPIYYNDASRSQIRSRIRRTIRNMFRLMALAHAQDLKRRQSFYRTGNDPYSMGSYYSYTVYRPKEQHKKKPKHKKLFVDTPEFGMKQIEENVVDLHNPIPFNNKFLGFTRGNLPVYFRKLWKVPSRKNTIKATETKSNERSPKIILENSGSKSFSEKIIRDERDDMDIDRSKGISYKPERFGFRFNEKFDTPRGIEGKKKNNPSINIRKHHISRRAELYDEPEFKKNSDVEYLDNLYGPFRNKYSLPIFSPRVRYTARKSNFDEIPFNGNARIISSMPQKKYTRDEAAVKISGDKRNLQEKIDKLALEANLKAQKIMKRMKKNPTKTLLRVIETFREYVRKIGEELGLRE